MRWSVNAPARVAWPQAIAAVCLAAVLGLALAGTALWPAIGGAQTTTTLPVGPEPSEPSLGFESPQATMRGYLTAARAGDWARAAEHLDLRGQAREAGPGLARQLKVVLDRSLWVDLGSLDDTIEGAQDDGLPPRRDLVGIVYASSGAVKIVVERTTAPDGTQEWKVARGTVQQIRALYAELGDGPLAEHLPRVLLEVSVLELQLWQWLGLLLLVAVAVLVAWLATALLGRLVSPLVRRTGTDIDDALRAMLVGPMRLVVATLLMAPGLPALRLSVPAQRVVLGVRAALLVAACTWVALRVTDALAQVAEIRFGARGPGAASVVPLGRRTAKVFVVAIAALLVLGNFGFDVTGVIAGLGVGGLAVALAAQKSLENLFGGVSIIADAPVRVGDFCRFGDRLGTVEDIGLRSTRLRTPERTLVTVPNAEFSTMQLENFGVRDRMLLQVRLALRYQTTADQLRWVLARLEQLLREHPKVLPDPARARLVGFGATAFEIEVFAYVASPDPEEFLRVREDLLLRIVEIVVAAGTGFSAPVVPALAASREYDAEEARRQAVEAEVARRRASTPG